jgi:phage shock protein C
MNDRLYRTVEDRMLLGVMGGISLRLGMDPSIIRIIYAIVTVVSGIFPLAIAYLVMAFVIPEAPPGWEASMRGAARGGSGSGAAGPTGWGAGDAGATGPGATVGPAGATGPTGWGAAPSAQGPTGTAGWETGVTGATGTAAGVDAGAAGSGGAAGPAWGAAWDADGSSGSGRGRRRGSDPRVGAIVGGLVLVGLGSLFLLVQLVPDLDWGVVGPVALVALGVILILGSIRRA